MGRYGRNVTFNANGYLPRGTTGPKSNDCRDTLFATYRLFFRRSATSNPTRVLGHLPKIAPTMA